MNLTEIIHEQIQGLSLPGFVKNALEKVVGGIMENPDKVPLLWNLAANRNGISLIMTLLQLVNALHTLSTFKSYVPINKIVGQALRSGNFYDIGEGAYALGHVVQVGAVWQPWHKVQ